MILGLNIREKKIKKSLYHYLILLKLKSININIHNSKISSNRIYTSNCPYSSILNQKKMSLKGVKIWTVKTIICIDFRGAGALIASTQNTHTLYELPQWKPFFAFGWIRFSILSVFALKSYNFEIKLCKQCAIKA